MDNCKNRSWKIQKLGELAEEVRDLYKPNSSERYPYIGLEHIEKRSLLLNSLGLSNNTISTKKKFKKGEILFGSLRPYFRKVLRPKFDGVCSTDITVIRPKKNCSADFLKYFIADWRFINYATSTSSGTRMPRANWKTLCESEWCFPSLKEQREIGSILSNYDNLIENNRKRIKILEEMARNLYREWFVKFRFPGHENVRFVDSPLGKIPENWKVKKLGDVVNLRKGKNISKKAARDGVVPVVGAGLNPAYYHDVSNAKQPVITISASGANAGYVNLYLENIWASDCSVIDSQSTSHVIFLYLYLKYKQMEITRMQRGSAQPHVYTKDLEKLNLVMPTRTIINKFEEIINPLFELNKNYLLRNNTLKKIRDIVLPKLVSGELDVSELDIEVPEKD